MSSMHPLIETHRAELLALEGRRGVTGVRVFGSMSRADDSIDSDVDLLVALASGSSALARGGLLLDAQECWVAVWMSSPKRACTPRCTSA